MAETKLLRVENIHKSFFPPDSTWLKRQKITVLNGVSFSLAQGECLGIIGESGSGKSTLARVLLGLEKPDSGTVLFHEQPLYAHALSRRQRTLRRHISVVFQDYASSVNPHLTVADTIAEPLYIHERLAKSEINRRVIDLLDKVGLSGDFVGRYPHQLSGGQLQRVCIARAIACRPQFIILDEAVSSLDVSVQVQILDLLKRLQQEMNLSYLFITHDLTAVTYLCQRVCFFADGRIVERVDSIDQLGQVKQEYSKRLLNAVMDF
jgi:nickel transport system ATP-binding protein